MEFDWDEDKRRANIGKHGVDFLYAVRMFRDFVLTVADDRGDYGERRWISIGCVGDEFFVVVHTLRDGLTRIISARKGGRRDRRKYQAGIAGRDRGDA